MQLGGVGPRVAAEQPYLTGVGAQQAEEDAQRGRLPRPVRAEEAVDLAGRHLEVELVKDHGATKGLGEPAEVDDG